MLVWWCCRVCRRSAIRSELNHGKTRNQPEVADIQCRDGIAKLQRRGTNQKIFEGNADAERCLLALDLSSELGDFECYGMDRQVTTQLFGKESSAFTVSIVLGPLDAVSQFDDSHR
jgi:hypothetical protein